MRLGTTARTGALVNDQKWTPESVTNLRANSRRRCTSDQATTSVDEDKWMKQLSAYHIGKDWLDSDAFCELQPIIGLASRYDRCDEWENVEHRNLIRAKLAKPALEGLILANCEAWNEDLVRMDVRTDGEKTSKIMSNLTVYTREREHHTAHIPSFGIASATLKTLSVKPCLNEGNTEYIGFFLLFSMFRPPLLQDFL